MTFLSKINYPIRTFAICLLLVGFVLSPYIQLSFALVFATSFIFASIIIAETVKIRTELAEKENTSRTPSPQINLNNINPKTSPAIVPGLKQRLEQFDKQINFNAIAPELKPESSNKVNTPPSTISRITSFGLWLRRQKT
ncbi:MAG: hypothetical protein JSS07_04255 [Proteobacteria bacterium]|nr:hypothetical protein [Pseudomonadota bacterium]